MDFCEIAVKRQSTRKYDSSRMVEDEKLEKILEVARLSPSACNGQPYLISVCRGKCANAVAKACMGMGMNSFAQDAPILLVISEEDYVRSAAVGAKLKNNDYRSMDIGILAAYITAEACELGLATCMLGWFDDKKIRQICSLEHPARLVIALGYEADEDELRNKKRKDIQTLVRVVEPCEEN